MLIAICAHFPRRFLRQAAATAGLDVSFHSVALDAEMHALVFLPAGYQRGTTRYPVIYFLHGLPAAATTYAGNKWLDTALDVSGSRRFSWSRRARATRTRTPSI